MKQILCALLLVILIQLAGLVMAHSDHGMINSETAVQIAHKTVLRMTFKDMGFKAGKLSEGWKSVPEDAVEVVGSTHSYYVLRVVQSVLGEALVLKIANSGEVLSVIKEQVVE